MMSPVRLLPMIALLLGCQGAPVATELVVAVDTDLRIPEDIDTVEFRITDPRGDDRTVPVPLTGAEAVAPPLTLGLRHLEGPLAPVRVRVAGIRSGSDAVESVVETGLVKNASLLVCIMLTASCLGRACDDAETCRDGACEPEHVDPEELPVWSGTVPQLDACADVLDARLDAGDGGADTGDAEAGACECDTDVNDDGESDFGDLSVVIDCLVEGGCPERADVDCDGDVDLCDQARIDCGFHHRESPEVCCWPESCGACVSEGDAGQVCESNASEQCADSGGTFMGNGTVCPD